MRPADAHSLRPNENPVAEAVRAHMEQVKRLPGGSLKSDVMLLTGLTPEDNDAVGGIDGSL